MKLATLLAAVATCAACASCPAAARADSAPIRLFVDLSDAPSRVVHVIEVVPAGMGLDDLVYPRWIPGEHSPSGSIDDLVNLRFIAFYGSDAMMANSWRRDS